MNTGASEWVWGYKILSANEAVLFRRGPHGEQGFSARFTDLKILIAYLLPENPLRAVVQVARDELIDRKLLNE